MARVNTAAQWSGAHYQARGMLNASVNNGVIYANITFAIWRERFGRLQHECDFNCAHNSTKSDFLKKRNAEIMMRAVEMHGLLTAGERWFPG
jgi:hypothetical protein